MPNVPSLGLFGDGVGNTVGDGLFATRQTSVAAAAGLGVGMVFQVQDNVGTFQDAARIAGVLRNVTPATVAGEIQFSTRTGGGALAERWRVQADGKFVGGPGAIVAAPATDFTILVEGQDADIGLVGWVAGIVDSGQAVVHGGVRSRGTLAAPLSVADGDALCYFGGGGWGSDNVLDPGGAAVIAIVVDGAPTPAYVPGGIAFLTQSGGAVAARRGLIRADGRWAIGADVPAAARKLTVFNTATDQGARTVGTAAAENVLDALVAGDAFPRWNLAANGVMSWGSGAGAVDTVLARNAANRLDISDGDSFDTLGAGAIENRGTPADVNPRMRLTFDALSFGAGVAAPVDWSIARTSANFAALAPGDALGVSTGGTFDVRAAAGDGNPVIRLTNGPTQISMAVDSADALSWVMTCTVSSRVDMGPGDSLDAIGAGRLEHRTTAADANPSVSISSNLIEMGVGGATPTDVELRRGAANRWEAGTGDSFSTIGAAAFENRAASGDANPRLQIAPATIDMGAGGGAAVDTRIGRVAANTWELGGDDSLFAIVTGVIGRRAATLDANPTVQLTNSQIDFGVGGATPVDSTIRRQAANQIEVGTGDQFWVVGAPGGRKAASGDANGVTVLGVGALLLGAGGATAPDVALARTGAATLLIDNNAGADLTLVTLRTAKFTVTGVIDPTALELSDPAAGTSLYIESRAGQTAPVAPANRGRMRYNATLQQWEWSENTGAYHTFATGAPAFSNVSPFAFRASWQHDAGSMNITEVGSTFNANTAGNAAVVNDATTATQYLEYTSGGAAGNQGGVFVNEFTLTTRQGLPLVYGVYKTPAGPANLLGIRVRLGACSADPMPVTDPAGVSLATFGYDTSVDGTAFWRVEVKDGVAAISRTATTLAFAASTRYEWAVDMTTTGSIRFWMNGQLLATIAANLPAIVAGLGFISRTRNLDGLSAKLHALTVAAGVAQR